LPRALSATVRLAAHLSCPPACLCLGRRGVPQRGLVNVRFVPEATELLRCREASLCATIRQLDRNPSYAKEQAATLPLAGEHLKKKQKMPFVAAFQRATRRPHR
jgi:hypothetical protein